MAARHPGFRIFVLGAGFSRPAGLPLAAELFDEVKRRIEDQYGTDTKFHRDLDDYLDYRFDCEGVAQREPVDLEVLMSYLDMEHYLGLRGKDTWSAEGNESQIMIRRAIGEFICERTPAADQLPDFYYRFAERLSLQDIVITLNYDVLLERAFEHVGKPYRLFPDRYKTLSRAGGGTLDRSIEEVVVLKLHGSLDWFDDTRFLETKKYFDDQGVKGMSINPVFDDRSRYEAVPIVSGLYPPDDPLLRIHRIRRVDWFYQDRVGFVAPYILSPSHVKFVYANTLLGFWHGLGQAGGMNLGVAIIGFSLPQHDEYIRIALHHIVTNYQQSWWDEALLDVAKDYTRFVDYRLDKRGVDAYMDRYRFSDTERSRHYFEGFGAEAVTFLFDQPRTNS
jgi:hypothetical protein